MSKRRKTNPTPRPMTWLSVSGLAILVSTLWLFVGGCNQQPEIADRVDRADRPGAATTDTDPDAAADSVRDDAAGSPAAPGTEPVVTDNAPHTEGDTASEDPEIDDTPALATESASEPTVTVTSTVVPEPPEPTRQRVLFMPANGPILVDLLLTHGTQSLEDRWREQVELLIARADADDDQRTQWSELLEHQLLLNLAFANRSIQEDQRETVARSYDANADGRVDATELLKLFGRNQASAGGFIVQAGAFDPLKNVSQSAVRKWLDRNGDGILSTEDTSTAPDRLRQRDDDQDDRLYPGDFDRSNPVPGMTGMNYDRRPRGPAALRLIHAGMEWSHVRSDLEEIYAFGSALTASDLGERHELFDFLDDNGNGDLSVKELSELATIPADLEIEVDLADRILRLATAPAETAATDEAPGGLASEGNSNLSVSAFSTQLKLAIAANQNNYLGQNLDDPKSVFESLDRDKNQYLDSGEGLQLRAFAEFSEVDLDDDERVDLDEFKSLLNVITAFGNSGTILSAQPVQDPVFAALDTNRSGQLEAREIQAAGERLGEIDTNRDGHLGVAELPSIISISIAGRTPAPFGQAVAAQAYAYEGRGEKTQAAAPTWFSQMDQNGDGEISRMEFLGKPEVFAELDKNSDGFLGLSEIDK